MHKIEGNVKGLTAEQEALFQAGMLAGDALNLIAKAHRGLKPFLPKAEVVVGRLEVHGVATSLKHSYNVLNDVVEHIANAVFIVTKDEGNEEAMQRRVEEVNDDGA